MKVNYLKGLGAMLIFSIFNLTMVCGQNAQIWKNYIGQINDPSIPMLPNYSFAGYKLGETGIPENFEFTIFDVTAPAYGAVPNDNNSDQAAIQAAIDAAEANGSGIVFFPPGEYLVNTDPNNTSPITINSSNIILKGSGSIRGGTIINMKNYMRLPSGLSNWNNNEMFKFKGPKSNSQYTIITNNANRGDYFISVENACIFKGAKFCRLYMPPNTDAIANYLEGKTPRKVWSKIINEGVSLEETHEIDSIDILNNRLYLKDPIIDDINSKLNWEVHTISLIENCGFEDISFKANFTEPFVHHKDYIHDYGWKAIKMSHVAHSWVRRCRFTNVSNSVKISDNSYASSILNILVDGNSGHALSVVDGGSSRILQGLIFDNTPSGQWHGADMSAGTCGSVIWRIDARKGNGVDFHASMPRTNLSDLYVTSAVDGAGGYYGNFPNHLAGLTFWNTERVGTSAANVSLWNDCNGNYCGLAVVNPIIVGYHGVSTTTFDQTNVKYEESNGTKVFPESLYEAQLKHRLEKEPSWINLVLADWYKLRKEW